MICSVERGLSYLIDHCVAVCLFLSLFILTWIGVGVFLPFILYNLVSMASSYAAYGNVTDGYASTQWIFPVIYLLMAAADGGELMLLKHLCVVWTAAVAAAGICQFAGRAVMEGSVRRAGGFLGNPNAMVFLIMTGAGLYRKQTGVWAKAGLAAFFLHNMMDTSFFYMVIPALVLMVPGDPRRGGKRTGPVAVKMMFGAFAFLFAFNLYCSVFFL